MGSTGHRDLCLKRGIGWSREEGEEKMNLDYDFLEKAFLHRKITKNFGVPEETVFSNFTSLLNNVMDKDEDISKEAQCLLSRLSIIDQESFISIALVFINRKINEYIQKIPKLKQNVVTYPKVQSNESNFLIFYENLFTRVNGIRIGDSFPKDINLSKLEAESYYDCIVNMIQSGETRFSTQENKMNIFALYTANNLSKISGIDRYYFYKLCNLAIELSIHSGDMQLARNNAEEISRLSRIENKQIYAFFIKGNCFLTQKNLNDALLYFCVVINSVDETIPFDFWESLFLKIEILYRELHFSEIENKYFARIQKYLSEFDLRIKDNFYMSHFASKFQEKQDVCNDVLLYLDENREETFKLGIDAFKGWYIFLFQIYTHSKNDALLLYIENFKKYIPSVVLTKLYKILGIDSDYKIVLNEIFNRVIETKYNVDRNSEIKMFILTINNYIEQSFTQQNVELFFNTFRLKTGLQFIAPENDEEGDVKVPLSESSNLFDYFGTFIEKFNSLKLFKDFNLLLCTKTEQNYYSLLVCENKKAFISLNFTLSDIKEIIASLPENMTFSPDEDYEMQKQTLKKQEESLSKLAFKIPDIKKPLMIIYDNLLCSIPSNVMEVNNVFISLKTKVLSLPSLDFLVECQNIEIKNNVSLWCPLENGDMPLNYAFSGVQSYLEQETILYETKMIPEKTLLSDISIIIAHGGKDIAHKQYFMANGSFGNDDIYYTDITKCIPKPKLVILFICHSGKTTKNLLYETSQSMQDLLFQRGAQAVIAPKWPLHTSIPGLWLPIFIEAMKNGKTSFESFSKAQDFIYQKQPNAGAWACLHYFGNPNIKFTMGENK